MIVYTATVMCAKANEQLHPYPAVDLDQQRVDTFLTSLLRERVPSLLFTGPEGSGKEYAAFEFARKLVCTATEKCPTDDPQCNACRQSLLLEHPDVHLVYPTPTQGTGEHEDGDVSDIAKVLDEKRQNLFGTYRFTKKASIRIARTRALIQQANLKPFSAATSVFVIIDAHAMREEAQNGLLKLVEEPPPHSVLVFVTHNPEAILYTIRSRCQRVRFSPLKPRFIETILKDVYDADAVIAKRAASAAHGNIRRAAALLEEFDDDDQQLAAAFIEEVGEAPDSWAIGAALDVARGASRETVGRFLHELSLMFRDVMVADPDLLINQDSKKLIEKRAKQWDRSRLPGVIDRIAGARTEILDRNLNVDATLVDLFLDVRRSLAR